MTQKFEITKKTKRNDVVPYYADMCLRQMIRKENIDAECKELNQRIIERWSVAGLLYIKEQAWKIIEKAGKEAWVAEKKQCDVCTKEWFAVYEVTGKVCCPNCDSESLTTLMSFEEILAANKVNS